MTAHRPTVTLGQKYKMELTWVAALISLVVFLYATIIGYLATRYMIRALVDRPPRPTVLELRISDARVKGD